MSENTYRHIERYFEDRPEELRKYLRYVEDLVDTNNFSSNHTDILPTNPEPQLSEEERITICTSSLKNDAQRAIVRGILDCGNKTMGCPKDSIISDRGHSWRHYRELKGKELLRGKVKDKAIEDLEKALNGNGKLSRSVLDSYTKNGKTFYKFKPNVDIDDDYPYGINTSNLLSRAA